MPSVQTLDEARDPAGFLGRLPDGYPLVVAPADESRLGRMLARLAAALDEAEIGRPAPARIRDELIGLVPRLRRYATALTCDPVEADERVQSTLLKAWLNREHLPAGSELPAWLFAVLRRTGQQDRWRGGAARSSTADDAASGDTPERRAMREALDRLTRAQREALLLVTVEGLSQEAAATIVGCSAEAVRERLDQAHERLARDWVPVRAGAR